MSVKTRLGIAPLLSDQMMPQKGSLTMPDEVTFYCPNCGSPSADKGQCLVEVAKVPGKSKTGFIVKIIVDCRSCGSFGEEPGVDP